MIHGGLKTHHSRDRGAISVLLLLTVVALVALLALVWNTGAYTTQREHVQLAADSSAHAMATWISRSTNLITAQNILICQYASAEVIWRAVRQINNFARDSNDPIAWAQLDFDPEKPPIKKTFAESIRDKLELEQQDAIAMSTGQNADLQASKLAIQNALVAVNTQYKATNDAYQKIAGLNGSKYFSRPDEIAKFNENLRIAGVVLNWLNQTYVNGQRSNLVVIQPMPKGPGPGLNGESLTELANDAMTKIVDPQWLNGLITGHIIPAIKDESKINELFEARGAPAMIPDVAGNMADQQKHVFENQVATAENLKTAINNELNTMESVYNCQIGLTLRSDPPNSGIAAAPVVDARQVPFVTNHFDTIRQTSVDIDPDNAQALTPPPPDYPGKWHGDARIWLDHVMAHVPTDFLLKYPFLSPTYRVDGWESDDHLGWGHVYGAPVQRYFTARVLGDASGLAEQIQGIDTRRDKLRQEIDADTPPVAPLPMLIYVVSGTPPTYVEYPFHVAIDFSRISELYGRDAALLAAFNDQLNKYIDDINILRDLILQISTPFSTFTRDFAISAWYANVDFWRCYKLRKLGQQKLFMVLATYALRTMPDWAVPDMQSSARDYIQNAIIERHKPALITSISAEFAEADPYGYKNIFPNRSWLVSYYAGLSEINDIATAVAIDAANQMAPELAAEWANRPWPYEITPPANPISLPGSPPGMGNLDRQLHFTVIAAAYNNPQANAHLVFPALLGQSTAPMLAYAQAESFNWMEFNFAYGGNDHYDQVNFVPSYYSAAATFIASPTCWRLCSQGGWNWQPRFAYSFDLSRSLRVNQPLADMFKEAGAKNVTGNLDPLILH